MRLMEGERSSGTGTIERRRPPEPPAPEEPLEEPPAGVADSLQLTRELKETVSILIVDDEESLCESCGSVLQQDGYQVKICTRGSDALEALRRRAYDIVLLDLYMAKVSGFELLEAALKANADTIVIVMTGKPSVDSSLAALRAGAWDYLPKPFSATHLNILIGRATHAIMVARDTKDLQAEVSKKQGPSEKVSLLGVAPAFQKAVDLARKVAPTDASVFLTGESGTGKELFAQFIHDLSRRSSRPFLAINCAALPDTLLESEMFGHVEGAFTGAVRDKPGLLETANGGTLFLDELADMPESIQAKLLRVIQDGVIRRVGSTKTDAIVNVRFIAATNRDPEEALAAGSLREDLYYRLRVVPIRLAPLRERLEDIPILARHFLSHYWKRHRGPRLPQPQLGEGAIHALQRRHWRGNVRELENVFEHAVVLLEPAQTIRPEDIPSLESTGAVDGESSIMTTPAVFTEEKYHEARERILSEFERNYLLWVVRHTGGNMSEAARTAAVDRTTLYRLMEKHNLERKSLFEGTEE